jgi:hypothetical protein
METKFDENIFKIKIEQDVKNINQLNNMFKKMSKAETGKKINIYKHK